MKMLYLQTVTKSGEDVCDYVLNLEGEIMLLLSCKMNHVVNQVKIVWEPKQRASKVRGPYQFNPQRLGFLFMSLVGNNSAYVPD